MSEDLIGYGALIDEAMHDIVKKALEGVEKEGLKGGHHFYISFATNHKDVKISEKLKEKYPEEITIVLQFQFEGLKVTKEGFEVTLSFEGVKEHLYVPFNALTAFADPSVKFGLQFKSIEIDEDFDDDDEEGYLAEMSEFSSPMPSNEQDKGADGKKTTKGQKAGAKSKKKKDSNVVQLDTFRKK